MKRAHIGRPPARPPWAARDQAAHRPRAVRLPVRRHLPMRRPRAPPAVPVDGPRTRGRPAWQPRHPHRARRAR
ncbi:hypothetical protein FNH06_39110 [Amycolatopsis acidiphila]|uniref:Uncharacterized protein n=1 Tax=Amycolatopsis acidiphila TaxID=715473 RepID=A0A557ZN60_9PSEU|nr:hypothetical protein FNH06_39110 [Amycolatopsis acidiphila]